MLCLMEICSKKWPLVVTLLTSLEMCSCQLQPHYQTWSHTVRVAFLKRTTCRLPTALVSTAFPSARQPRHAASRTALRSHSTATSGSGSALCMLPACFSAVRTSHAIMAVHASHRKKARAELGGALRTGEQPAASEGNTALGSGGQPRASSTCARSGTAKPLDATTCTHRHKARTPRPDTSPQASPRASMAPESVEQSRP